MFSSLPPLSIHLAPPFSREREMFKHVLASEAYRPYGNRNRDHIYGGNEQFRNLDRELWQACAGPNVYAPKVGDRVMYFLQGHLEQIEGSAVMDEEVELPKYNVPPKILCKVINVVLQAEHQTDEIFAQVTLVPETGLLQQEISLDQDEEIQVARENGVLLLTKTLTLSDTNPHGGLSLHKRQAEECLPPLDMTQQPPVQDLVARDMQGNEWHFRHTYRGHPKRHLITSGWSAFLSTKKLVLGDTCIFLSGPRGALRVGVSRAMKSHKSTPAPMISAVTMQHGILASATHALSAGPPFTLYHRPWTSAEFIIPYHRYIKSMKNIYSVGDLVIMRPDAEECTGQSWLGGIVVGCGDKDRIKWPDSEWRYMEVKWEAVPSGKQSPPRRVSPWEIEPLDWTKMKQPQPNQNSKKRPRSPDMRMASTEHGPCFIPTWNGDIRKGVFQGQDCNIALGDANVPAPSTSIQAPQADPHQNIVLELNDLTLAAPDMLHQHRNPAWQTKNSAKDDADVSVAQPSGSRKVMKLFGKSVEL